jgi:hypothetical protein
MAILALCNCRIQKWHFFDFPAPPRGFLQKKGQKWQKMAKNDPFLDPFLSPEVPGFQGFCLKNGVKNDPLIDLLWSVPGSQGPRMPFPL